ncbi:MAG TPA: PIN domain-containing protein [Solirubrobacteraceae bacterium]|nr:PIN domain-containing protein [Solirubrobacteraceae bacterium]
MRRSSLPSSRDRSASRPVVIDTDVFSAELISGSALAERYAPIIAGRPAFISFQTAAEVRYGASYRGWGTSRLHALESRLAKVEIVHSGPELVMIHAQLRADSRRVGHPLAQRAHNADRLLAATAVRLGVSLVSNDAIFQNVSGLRPSSAPKTNNHNNRAARRAQRLGRARQRSARQSCSRKGLSRSAWTAILEPRRSARRRPRRQTARP